MKNSNGALRKMIAGRAKAILHRSFYSPVLFRLELRPCSEVPTLCTDGRSLFFNPDFVICLKDGALVFFIFHETLHCVLLHPSRRGDRDPELWNIAADLLVNAILVFEERMVPPEGIILDKKYWKKKDGSFWTIEEIYDDLAKNPEASKKKYGLKHSCIRRDPAASSEDDRANRSFFCEYRGWEEVSWDKEMSEVWKEALVQMEQLARMRGTVPGWLERIVQDLVEPSVPIERILRFIVGNVSSDETTWRSPDRRFISKRVHLPSALKDRKDVVFVVDTSGSIDEEEIQYLFGIVSRALRMKGISSVRVIQCDREITDDRVYRSLSAFRSDVLRIGAIGGGGTSFVPPFERLRQEHAEWKVACLVYLTDLMGDFPDFRPRYPVYWISVLRNKAPFGCTYYWNRATNKVEIMRDVPRG